MKKFYLLRHEDVHNNSGVGVVAEGIIFDSGLCAMTWLTDITTVTMFPSINTVKQLHGHEGKTEVIVEGAKADKDKYDFCRVTARQNTTVRKIRKASDKINAPKNNKKGKKQ